MLEVLFLLLPIAACSGWYIGRKTTIQQVSKREQQLSGNYYAGLNYLLNEQPDKAVDAFLKILDLDNEMIEIHLLLGNLFRRRGEVDRSIRIHQGLLARPALFKTQRAILLLELGKDYYHAGMYDRAEDLFLRLIDSREQLEASFYYLLNIYQQARDWDKAIVTAGQAQSVIGKDLSVNISHYYCELAEQSIKNQQEPSVTMKLLKKAMRTNKNSVRASILYGSIFKNLGKYNRALKFYKQVYQQDPQYLSLAIAPITECYIQSNNKKGVVEYLRECFSFKTSNNSKSEQNDIYEIYAVLQFIELLKEQEGLQSSICYISEYLRVYPSLQGLNKMIELHLQEAVDSVKHDLQVVSELIKTLIAKEPKYRCEACGFPSNTLQWQCPGCRGWWGSGKK